MKAGTTYRAISYPLLILFACIDSLHASFQLVVVGYNSCGGQGFMWPLEYHESTSINTAITKQIQYMK